MSNKPLWLISYDISCPRRLKKVHKYCAKRGWPLQKSLFVMALTKAERQTACDYLVTLINKESDKLLCLPFTILEGSFHLMPQSPLMLIHSDPRLEGFVS
ncbi:CRISPR-associated endonuclease Cas2 [Pseudoalteromonas sp. SS15]|uniref:CRISPR-associated endonuclease Cas2 n=1 Tax=Pseudoalteromonas sp. SS15 TaxID=3139393 RepID=UPI003BA8D181